MNLKRTDKAVSEIIGTVILLAIAISTISAVYATVLSDSGPFEDTIVTVVGRLDGSDVVFEHRSGEPLGLNSKVLLTIGGIELSPMTLDYLLDDESKSDGLWNIGEAVIFSDIDVTGLQVRVTIIDEETNSVVLWGILEEGYVAPLQGRGGIWHLNENSGNITYDSSPNSNHGTIFDATWTTGVNSSALSFDGLNDHVRVNDSYGIDIFDGITVEAWMKPLTEKFNINRSVFDAKFAYDPNIIHIYDDVYLVAGQGTNGKGILHTVKIADDGQIKDVIGANKSIFDDDGPRWELEPNVIKISDEIYAVVYIDKDEKGAIKTYNITYDGQINNTPIDSFIFNYPKCNEPNIIKVFDGIYAVAYGFQDSGIIRTFSISNTGYIGGSPIDSLIFVNNSKCDDPNIIHISDDIYAIACITNNTNEAILKTVNIMHSGVISNAPLDNFTIDSPKCDDPNLIRVSDHVYAIVYENEKKGVLKTINISHTGQINNTIIDHWIFELNTCHDPNIINAGENVYVIAYESQGHEGHLTTIEILTNGSILETKTSTHIFETGLCFEPNIIQVSTRVFAIAYRSQTPHKGVIMTIRLGEDATSSYKRGVYKEGSYGLYTNLTYAFAFINGKSINISGVVAEEWNHIALTYDRNNITLYLNNVNVQNNILVPYDRYIKVNDNNLLFGHFFNGLIDEIAIYDKALSPEEILYHYNHPGEL